MNEMDLALTYGGFTTLDKVYLEGILKKLTPADRLRFITPPPSVINAYFAEIYQKQGAQEATEYYLDLSKHLDLFQEDPSFAEEKPFVRLNLSGKAFGFAYQDETTAQVFAQEEVAWTADLLWEIAQVFPHYVVYLEDDHCYMKELAVGELIPQTSPALLTEIEENENFVKVAGLNTDEVLEVARAYQGQRYAAWDGRTAILYIENRKNLWNYNF